MTAKVFVEGIPELVATLNQLPVTIHKQALRKPIYRGAQLVRDKAKALVTVKTGNLRKNIKVKGSRGTPTLQATKVYVQYGSSGAPYAHLVEKGFMHISGRHVPARPFMRPALETSVQEIIQIVSTELKASLTKFQAKALLSAIKKGRR
jgi:HK97 gp10 family phage protein